MRGPQFRVACRLLVTSHIIVLAANVVSGIVASKRPAAVRRVLYDERCFRCPARIFGVAGERATLVARQIKAGVGAQEYDARSRRILLNRPDLFSFHGGSGGIHAAPKTFGRQVTARTVREPELPFLRGVAHLRYV